MTPVAKLPETAESLKVLYGPIANELADVERLLRQEMRSEYPFVDELVRYGNMLGGKRLRPALLLLAAKSLGKVSNDHTILGAVVEMIHTATLIHDDVIDEADTRRHLATVNARWDNQASVLLGDFLFTHAFYLSSTLETVFACRTIGWATNVVCEGELRQKGNRGNFELSESEYTSIIEAKTAELTACSCLLGAHYAGATEAIAQRFSNYGRYLGIAFQIADDLLDVLGNEALTGKSLGTDLDQQKPTLPIIRLLQQVSASEREVVLSILQSDGIDRRESLAPWLTRCDAIEYTRQQAQAYANRAREELDGLPTTPALQVLRQLTDFVVMRAH
ncbi:MAG TPA: polyprenyl synthetase family protein [Pirellulaceae bacterium]|nr:polyprenyl synthetase family protein [Pirellulaceae bacterium]